MFLSPEDNLQLLEYGAWLLLRSGRVVGEAPEGVMESIDAGRIRTGFGLAGPEEKPRLRVPRVAAGSFGFDWKPRALTWWIQVARGNF